MSETGDDKVQEARGGNGAATSEEPAAPTQPEGVAPAGTADGGLQPVEEPASDPLDKLTRECADLRDQLLRRRADFENYKRRVSRDREAAVVEAECELLKALVPSLDNLERALQAGGDESAVREGVALIQREVLSALESRGLQVLDPGSQPFDPEVHQALVHESVPGHEDGMVVEVFGKGYTFKERLLRPALVKVAKGNPAKAAAAGQAASDALSDGTEDENGSEALH